MRPRRETIHGIANGVAPAAGRPHFRRRTDVALACRRIRASRPAHRGCDGQGPRRGDPAHRPDDGGVLRGLADPRPHWPDQRPFVAERAAGRGGRPTRPAGRPPGLDAASRASRPRRRHHHRRKHLRHGIARPGRRLAVRDAARRDASRLVPRGAGRLRRLPMDAMPDLQYRSLVAESFDQPGRHRLAAGGGRDVQPDYSRDGRGPGGGAGVAGGPTGPRLGVPGRAGRRHDGRADDAGPQRRRPPLGRCGRLAQHRPAGVRRSHADRRHRGSDPRFRRGVPGAASSRRCSAACPATAPGPGAGN